MINPGTVAAIAASLMAQGENLTENGEIFSAAFPQARRRRISHFVGLAWEIAEEAENQRAPHHVSTCKAHDKQNA